MTTTPTKIITRTRALCEAATPGPALEGQSAQDYADALATGKRALQDALPELLIELADALESANGDIARKEYLHEEWRKESWEVIEKLRTEIGEWQDASGMEPLEGGDIGDITPASMRAHWEVKEMVHATARDHKLFCRRQLEALKEKACDALGIPGTTDTHTVGDRIEMLIKALERERDKQGKRADEAEAECERLRKEL